MIAASIYFKAQNSAYRFVSIAGQKTFKGKIKNEGVNLIYG